jgi:O-acetylserine/cysteine efflux transporter
MPTGLAAIVVHTQALFTIGFAAALLGERPTRRQWLGAGLALGGLGLIALTVGGDVPPAGSTYCSSASGRRTCRA